MSAFYKETTEIYRLKIPFDTVYTSVFLIVTDNNKILVDCATTESDVKNYILPALNELGYDLSDINALVVTHKHEDHAGGLDTILTLAPDIMIINGVYDFGDGICTYPLAGHTEDFIGVFDEKDGSLITGDGLQGAGIGKFRCSLETKSGYLETLDKIRADQRINTLLFSHEYEPWYKNCIFGRENILNCLSDCKKYVQ